jgi:hypothetical protein
LDKFDHVDDLCIADDDTLYCIDHNYFSNSVTINSTQKVALPKRERSTGYGFGHGFDIDYTGTFVFVIPNFIFRFPTC